VRGAGPGQFPALTAQRLVALLGARPLRRAPQACQQTAEKAPFDPLRHHAAAGELRARPQPTGTQRQRRGCVADVHRRHRVRQAPGDEVVGAAAPQRRVDRLPFRDQRAQCTQRLADGVCAGIPTARGDGALNRLRGQAVPLTGGDAERLAVGDGARVRLTPVLHQALGRYFDGARTVGDVCRRDPGRGCRRAVGHGRITSDQVSVSELPP
jgi:hypothetical protein